MTGRKAVPEGKEYTPPTNRIEAFSDGVFAIIVTLLVLELKVPQLGEHFSSRDAVAALAGLMPKFLGFALSFLMVAIFWVNHHQFFHTLKSADRTLLWLNNHFLFWMCFIPFPTAFLGEYPMRTVPVMVFGAALGLAGMGFVLMRRHAMKSLHLVHDGINAVSQRAAFRRSLVGPLLYGIAVLSAPFSVYLSVAVFFVVPVLYFLPGKILQAKS